jgi:type IV pilus assembly protein PilY1
MSIEQPRPARARAAARRALHGLLAVLVTTVTANAEVSQTPLYLGGGNVPGNLVLVPSVEWPTINSVANLGDYTEAREYLGYFDPRKCYAYSYNANEALRHFYPTGWATSHRCSGQWSGNYMNWAATQTIDPFRSVLTGGNRVRDDVGETWLEKARHDGQGGAGIYPNRRLPAAGNGSALMSGATPFSVDWMRMRVEGLGNKMRFRLTNDDTNTGVVAYDPAAAIANVPYEMSIRVKVCVANLLEPNCRQYSGGWKPEGLIQQYSEELRISLFGYLNDANMLRDGGALRARQKFTGSTMIVPGTPGKQPNPNAEWDSTTGVLIRNPNPADAAATSSEFALTILDSGAINYLNKFGQLTSNPHKNYDPVSELMYTALRYMRNLGNVPDYTNMGAATAADRARFADGFPVITGWDDPIQYACQKNVILGIGDVYTHRDKNLPGSSYGTDEPGKPALVSADSTLDVVAWTNRVGQLEGLGSIANTNSWSGRNNSAYMAGLAYFANTTDLRADLPGNQTVSTHWVDVLEAQSLEAPVENQYYLATKYGGFDVPKGFDPLTFTGPLTLASWHSNADTLVSFGPNANPVGYSFPRPDNYYVAGEANQMVASLTTAFARIAAELRSSASSVAANSTRVDADTAVFQAAFDSHRWSGEMQAFRVTTDGDIASTASWNAATVLDAVSEASLNSRKIFTVLPPTAASGGALLSTSGVNFLWGSLNISQQDAIRRQPGALPPVSVTVGQDRLNYLRGSRMLEQPAGFFRQRDSRLGDIVNSDPQFIHHQDFGYTLLSESGVFSSSVAGAYRTFRQSPAYQGRPAMVVVGANDGMLHGFDASLGSGGGRELFAFVPHAAFDKLYELTLPSYAHRYFVDGTPRVADAYLGGALGWRTIAVGATGAGGASVFALDVTSPETMTSSNVLWEFTHPDMGYTIGQPSVAPLPNGQFGVIVTSGYKGSTTNRIWVLNAANGSILHTFVIPNSGDLGAPLLSDLDGDRVADRIYVGDSAGNLWRFDLLGSSPSAWAPPAGLRSGTTPLPLFVARDANGVPQAITAPPVSAFNQAGEHTLFFGTGSFYRIDDNVVPVNPSVDSFYGIIDRGVPAVRANLVQQEILTEQRVNGMLVRAVTDNQMTSGQSGWHVDLVWKASHGGPGPKGERVVSRAVVRGDRVIFTTLIPDRDPCSPGGESWLMELNAFSGSRLDTSVFDVNLDDDFDDDDLINVTLSDGTTIAVPVSAIGPENGIMDTPAIISGIGEDQDEIKVLSGSSGRLIRIPEAGGVDIGRQSWRELR